MVEYADYWRNIRENDGELVYIAFGDSAAQGVGAKSPEKGYVALIAQKYSQAMGKSVRIINLSKSGAKAQDILDIQLIEYQKLGIDKPDLVTIEIGANDMRRPNLENFYHNFNEIIKYLPSGTFVSDVPDNGNPDNRKNKAVSAIMQKIIKSRQDLHFVPLGLMTANRQKIFSTYAYDLFHPNNKGYQIWVDAFWGEISKRLDK